MATLKASTLFASVAMLLGAASASGSAFLMDSSALSAEVDARAAALVGARYPLQKRQARALATCRDVLATPSSTLAGDLRIARDAARALERVYPEGRLRGLLDGFIDGGDGLVRSERDILQALVAALDGAPEGDAATAALEQGDRRLLQADAARQPSRRARFLAMALEDVREGIASLDTEGTGEGETPLSTASAKTNLGVDLSTLPEPAPWIPDSVSATVTVDAEGTPVAVRILLVQTSAGAPLSTMEIEVAAGFTGAGSYKATAVYDYDGMATPGAVYTPTGGTFPNDIEVTGFDLETRRLEGTFSLLYMTSPNRVDVDITDGVFDIRGFAVEVE
jgi:hypothetical protein